MLLLWSVAAYAAEPAWFEYEFSREVGSGTGTYAGYSDRTASTGRYELGLGAPDEVEAGARVTAKAHYEWSYSSSSEPSDSGSTTREFGYDRTTWRYTSSQLDLDDAEWSGVDATTLGPWFQIRTDAQVGDALLVLDQTCRVEVIEPVHTPAGDRPAIKCVATGTGQRNDSYGAMATTYDD